MTAVRDPADFHEAVLELGRVVWFELERAIFRPVVDWITRVLGR